MDTELKLQGRIITPADLHYIRNLIANNPTWHRTRISEEIATQWNWYNDSGRLKDMACRTMLLKLEKKGLVQLPPPKRKANNDVRTGQTISDFAEDKNPLSCSLKDLGPLTVSIANTKPEAQEFNTLLQRHHYLGYHRTVGENLKYIIKSQSGRPLACLLFGSSAWSCAARDRWIGWTAKQRHQHLNRTTNNTRFLILPWVQVPHLASHILGQIARRISTDWEKKYGHSIWMLETFVDLSRYQGTCYRAANWHCVGETQGRSRNDRKHRIDVPVKAVYTYPLHKQFRLKLTQ